MTPATPDTSDLGPMPEPEIEPKEPNPGGADAVEPPEHPPAVHDLDPADNPAVEEQAPDEISQGEDTGTAATEGDPGQDSDDDPAEDAIKDPG